MNTVVIFYGERYIYDNDADAARARTELNMDYYEAQYKIAEEMLSMAFGAEWQALSTEGRALCVRDFTDTDEEEELTATEYARRIGGGNLAVYAEVMAVRLTKGWK